MQLQSSRRSLLSARPSAFAPPPQREAGRALVGVAAIGLILTVSVCSLLVSSNASADAREQAKRIHDRIAGVPPSAAVLNDMENDINGSGNGNGTLDGSALGAAYTAMDNPSFYKVTLKNLATPWTNGDFDVFAPLNDYSATIVGMVRDNRDFREILTANAVYVGDLSHSSLAGVAPYSTTDNSHYEQMENANADLSDPAVLRASTQTSVYQLADAATAGVMTTRAAAKAFFIDGTNRAMFRFTLLNHMCHDMEQVKDTTRSADRIRQDVSRSPGGDSRLFLNNCVGCHSGMDPMAGAFAFYDYVNAEAGDDGTGGFIQYIAGQVDAKYHINETTFRPGFVSVNDSWENYWREGPNADRLGWDESLPGRGTGAKSLGQELAYSEAFAQCQVKKVFRNVCLRDAGESDRSAFNSMVSNFKSSGYNLKSVFAESAVYCMGD